MCLHWFNPLVRRMAREIDRACELACDEAVLLALEPGERRAYGDMLLRAAAAGEAGGAFSATLSRSGKLLKERLTAIMNFKKTTRAAAALSLVLTIAVTAGAAAAGAYRGAGSREDPDAAFFYTQGGYYQEPYLFEIAWNISEPAAKTYTSTRAALPKGGAITVYFEDSCQGLSRDKAAMAALSALLGRLRSENQTVPVTRPLVVSVRNIQGADPAALAERYYQQGALTQFGAVFALLDEAAREAMLERLYDGSSTDFFSVALKQLEPDSPLAMRLAERAYGDGNIAFFSLLAGHMERQAELEAWLVKARRDGRLDFTSVLLDALGREEELERVKAELEDQLVKEYAAYGITRTGSEYRFQNQLVRIFLDVRSADNSFVTLDTNPNGTVDIKVTRDADGAIAAVSPMSGAEAEALLADLEDGDDGRDEPMETPVGGVTRTVSIPRLGPEQNGIWWLGEYTLSRGDQIRYSVSARTGETLQVGFARGLENPANRSFYSVSRRRKGSVLRCAAGFSVSPEEEGSYRLFVRVPEGSAEGIRGHVVITPREELERRPSIPTAEQVLAARERALAGMTQEQVRRLKLVVREANLWWEHQYFYSNIFGRLEDPDDLYWNYFEKTGEIQIGWAYDGDLDKDAVCQQENLTEDQFYARYGTQVVTENWYTADDFAAILDELMESVRDKSLRSALGYVREEARLAKERHSMEHADNEYRALHDLDYFLLRYGPTDVGPYVIDDSTVTKYYGTLSFYGESTSAGAPVYAQALQ